MLSRLWGPLEAPLDDSTVHMVLQVLSLSLSQGRKVGLPLEVW